MTNGQGNGWTPPQGGGNWGNPAQPPQQPQQQPQQQQYQPPQQPPPQHPQQGHYQSQQQPQQQPPQQPPQQQYQQPAGFAQPQQPPMQGGMPGQPPNFQQDPFAGLNSGDTSERHPFLNAGFAYKLRIHRIHFRPARSGKALYIIEADVLETNDPGLPPGTRTSSFIDMSNADMRGANIARFVSALFGWNPSSLPKNSDQAPWPDAQTGQHRTWTDYAHESVADTNPWGGRDIGCRTEMNAKRTFTNHNWAPFAETDIPVLAASFPQQQPMQQQPQQQPMQQPQQQPMQQPQQQQYQAPPTPPQQTPQQAGYPAQQPQQPQQAAYPAQQPQQTQQAPQQQAPQQQAGGPPNAGGWGQTQ